MAQMTPLSMTRDINGYNTFGLPNSNNKYSALLQAGAEQNTVVPSTGNSNYQNVLAVFSFAPGSNVWVAINDTAVAPGGAISSTSSELNPAPRFVKPGDTVSFITNDTLDEIGVSFYAVN